MKAGTLSSVATISIPRPPVESVRPVLKAPTGTPQRVLLVDDSRSIRTLLKIYLMARNFEYVEAESGEEALKVLEQGAVDLVLTDFRMEGMNGAEFATQVRASKSARVARTPILMMTGDPNVAEVRTQGQKAGINAFVRKPVSCAQLRRAGRTRA
jgi:CheY-like chemotaxis protein